MTRGDNMREIAAAMNRLAMTRGERLAMTFSFSSSRGGQMSDVVIYGWSAIASLLAHFVRARYARNDERGKARNDERGRARNDVCLLDGARQLRCLLTS